jgi:hypothetical protein
MAGDHLSSTHLCRSLILHEEREVKFIRYTNKDQLEKTVVLLDAGRTLYWFTLQ